MSIRLMVLAGVALLPAMAAAPAAMAQNGYPVFPSPFASEPTDDGPGCTPMCAQDYAPCDPYYFKQAEGRCQVNHHGNHHR